MKTGSTSEVGQRWRRIIIEGSPEDRAEFRRLLLSGSDRDYVFEECLTGASGLTAMDAAGPSLIIELPDEPLWLHADPTRMTQILANLLCNSAKYTQPGGGIVLLARRHDDTVVISVADNGLGIAADMMSRVFDMFTQVNLTLERAQGGLGIGLALVKRLVAMHGGAIEAHSNGVKRSQTESIWAVPSRCGFPWPRAARRMQIRRRRRPTPCRPRDTVFWWSTTM